MMPLFLKKNPKCVFQVAASTSPAHSRGDAEEKGVLQQPQEQNQIRLSLLPGIYRVSHKECFFLPLLNSNNSEYVIELKVLLHPLMFSFIY